MKHTERRQHDKHHGSPLNRGPTLRQEWQHWRGLFRNLGRDRDRRWVRARRSSRWLQPRYLGVGLLIVILVVGALKLRRWYRKKNSPSRRTGRESHRPNSPARGTAGAGGPRPFGFDPAP